MDDPDHRRMGAALHEVIPVAATARRRRAPRLLAVAPLLTVAVFALPIGVGLLGTLLPAFGYLPAIGGEELSLEAWRTLATQPGFGTSVLLTVTIGAAATVLAVVFAFSLCAFAYGRRWASRLSVALAPLLSTPHSALALGFAFLIAPSGWAARAVSPWPSGWSTPPDVATVGHPSGWPVVAALLLKEVPYLALMIIGALAQLPAERHLAIARSLGYRRADAWIKVILPQVYRQVRLPVFAVLAFSLSVVDVALILGPGNPPPLAVLAVRWFGDADIRWVFPAAAAACLQLAIVVGAIGLWRWAEMAWAARGRAALAAGRRSTLTPALVAGFAGIAALLWALAVAAMLGMALWSFAVQWRFPAALPLAWSLAGWTTRIGELAAPAAQTVAIGVTATLLALVLVLACLENEARSPRRVREWSLWVLYLPLLVPQVAFLFGIAVLLVRLAWDGAWATVVWAHLVFVLPYVFLSLADPWRALDPRYARAAASLGASPARIFARVKLPLLLRPILIAAAVGFAVSVGLYLPTVFAGNGRVATLTTDAVTLAAGADRRVIGAYAVAQALFPLVAFVLAALAPAIVHADRRGMGRWG
jgi:putative thiamine transport system permease protein